MFNTALDDEPEILQQLTGGDELAFARLYQHYYSSVHDTVHHILPSPQLVEDVTQEIFLRCRMMTGLFDFLWYRIRN